jgi:lactoylglutathione lyase
MKIKKLDHIGIRVMNWEISIPFYEQFGFMFTRKDDNEHVVVFEHPSGVVINLLDSGKDGNDNKNILMDVDERYPGYTHYSMEVESAYDAKEYMESAGIKITGGPVTFGDGNTAIFIRDPDMNVIEFTEAKKT